MVELPHAHAMFVVPAAISMGLLNQRRGAAQAVRMPAVVSGAALLGLVAAATILFVDYRRAEADLMALRIRAARIGDLSATEPPRLWLLGQLGGVLRSLRADPLGPELDDLSRTASRYPSAPLLFQSAKAAALHSRPDDAERSLALLCSLQTDSVCQQAVQAWKAQATTAPPMAAVRLPSEPQ
jgi:hypothetical protein